MIPEEHHIVESLVGYSGGGESLAQLHGQPCVARVVTEGCFRTGDILGFTVEEENVYLHTSTTYFRLSSLSARLWIDMNKGNLVVITLPFWRRPATDEALSGLKYFDPIQVKIMVQNITTQYMSKYYKDKLLALLSVVDANGKVSLDKAIKKTFYSYEDSPSALGTFRQFRFKINEQLHHAGVSLSLNVDRKKRSKLEDREVYFLVEA